MNSHRHSIPEVEEIALRAWAKHWSDFIREFDNPEYIRKAWDIRRSMRAIYFNAFIDGYRECGFGNFEADFKEAIGELHEFNNRMERAFKKHKNRKKQ